MKKSLFWAAIGTSFLWMAFVYASFYLVPEQRPLNATQLDAIGGTLLDLLAAAVLLFIGAGAGQRVCRWLGLSPVSPLEQLVLTTGLGLGVISLLVLALGLVGGLTRWAMALLALGLALVSLPGLVATARALRDLRPARRPPWLPALYLGATLQ